MAISRTRRLIGLETHRAVFTWVLQCLSVASLVKSTTVGIDATTLKGERRVAQYQLGPDPVDCQKESRYSEKSA
jgi:hypothetical protein